MCIVCLFVLPTCTIAVNFYTYLEQINDDDDDDDDFIIRFVAEFSIAIYSNSEKMLFLTTLSPLVIVIRVSRKISGLQSFID